MKATGDLRGRERCMVRDWESRQEEEGALKEATDREIKKGTEALMTAGNSLKKVTNALWAASYTRATVDCQGR